MKISALSSVGRAVDLYSTCPWFESKRADNKFMKEALHTNKPVRKLAQKMELGFNVENSALVEAFQNLPQENRDAINADLDAKRKEGMAEDLILNRLFLLIGQHNKFLDMNSLDSDRKYVPRTSLVDIKQKAEDAQHRIEVNDAVHFFEHTKKHKSKRQTKYKN